MNNLLKLEWRKSSSFRRTTLALLAILAILALPTIFSRFFSSITDLLLAGLAITIVVLTIIGSLLYLKDDFDSKAPLNIILPFSGRQVVISKILVFLANVLLISFLFFMVINLYIWLSALVHGNYYTNLPDYIIELINDINSNVPLALVKSLIFLLEAVFYSSLTLVSILFIRSKQGKTGSLKWVFLVILIVFLVMIFLKYINLNIPYHLNLNDLKFDLLAKRDQVTIEAINSTFELPIFNNQILYFVPTLSFSTFTPIMMLIPFFFKIILSVIFIRFSSYLIDRKIDF